jgi:signal transduction histidine kinase
MEGWQQRLGSLSWRLILSYLLVTLVVALTMMGALVVSQAIQVAQQAGVPPGGALGKQGTASVGSVLEQATPDPEALRYLVATPLFDDLKRQQPQLTLVAILDHHGRLLTAVACGREPQLSSISAASCVAEASRQADTLLASVQEQTAVHDIFTDGKEAAEVNGMTSTGERFVATAILGSEKQPIGVLIAVFAGIPSAPGSPQVGLDTLLAFVASDWTPTGFVLILLVGVVGTLTGVVFSRSLTRRLRRIMQAAQAWSLGEFQMEVRDAARDEVGQLARNLNSMATRLQLLVIARHELAVVEERRRLQRDLHDAVKQHLFATKMHVAAARTHYKEHPEEAYQSLVEAEQVAGIAELELTTLIAALRPVALTASTFLGAVEEQCQAWSRRSGIHLEVRAEGLSALPAAIEEALFRVVQEALTNIARHSGATEAHLRLSMEEQTLALTLLDNGHGFATPPRAGGIGLQSMRERITAVGGILEIQSTAAGTCIEARVPIPLGAKNDD